MDKSNVNIYTDQETAKLESEVRNLEDKNSRLRNVISKMGISVIGVETG